MWSKCEYKPIKYDTNHTDMKATTRLSVFLSRQTGALI